MAPASISTDTRAAATGPTLIALAIALGVGACADVSGEAGAAGHALDFALDGGCAPSADTASEIDASVPSNDAAGRDASADSGDWPASPSIVSLIEDEPPNSEFCKASVRPARDGGAPELVLERFSASLGGVNVLASASCIIALTVEPPEGQTFALEEITGVGEVSLPEGALASFSLWYGPNAVTDTPPPSPDKVVQIRGPLEGPVSSEFTFKSDERAFWPCGYGGVRLRLYLQLLNQGAHRRGEASWTSLRLAKLVTRPCPQ